MKVVVLKKFTDKYTGRKYAVGDNFTCSKLRYKELQETLPGFVSELQPTGDKAEE